MYFGTFWRAREFSFFTITNESGIHGVKVQSSTKTIMNDNHLQKNLHRTYFL